MTVAAILARKTNDLVWIDAAASVGDAAARVAQHRIGALPVMSGEKLVGILSERDIVHRIVAEGAAVLGQRVDEVMTSPAITIPPDCSVLTALSQMSARRIRHLPVVEGGRVTGIVSIGDLVAYRIARIEQEAEALRSYIAGA